MLFRVRRFDRLNLVPQRRGLFVVFVVDRRFQFVFQPHQLMLTPARIRSPPRQLAAVLHLAVDVLQQRQQIGFKFGEYIDVVYMQLALQAYSPPVRTDDAV